MRLAVDAANLARDRRGMGRLARAALRVALDDASIQVTLLAERGDDVRALRDEFPGTSVRWPITAQGRAYDVVWFPFNGMRFTCSAPALVTLHDVFAFTEPHRARVARFREQAPIRRAAREAERIITDSHWSRDEIVRVLRVRAERVAVVLPAPDAFWFPRLGDELPRGIAGRRYALLVGAGEARKNARLALEACARAMAGTDEQLVIAGTLSPADRAHARRLQLTCGEIAASDPLLRALYRKAHVVLVPSFAEGFGMVAAEALACGAPVIASNTSALPEAAGGAALLLDPRSVDEWVRAIRRVFDDEAYASTLRVQAANRFASSDRSSGAHATIDHARAIAR